MSRQILLLFKSCKMSRADIGFFLVLLSPQCVPATLFWSAMLLSAFFPYVLFSFSLSLVSQPQGEGRERPPVCVCALVCVLPLHLATIYSKKGKLA